MNGAQTRREKAADPRTHCTEGVMEQEMPQAFSENGVTSDKRNSEDEDS